MDAEVAAIQRRHQRGALLTASRATQFVLLAVLFLANRGRRLLPTTAAERELWTIWIGYLVAFIYGAQGRAL